jgi:hypothetical protein
MLLLAEISAAELSVRSSIEGLGRLFAIVLALAIGEAFKQFISDKAEKPEDRYIHFDRIWGLITFVVLVVPFFHGMVRYFFETYQEAARPKPYTRHLFIDSIVFTFESFLFFVLSRSLPSVQWRRFYWTVFLLLVVDIVWGSFGAYTHEKILWSWVYVNIGAALLVGFALWFWRDPKSLTSVIVCMLILIARTVLDYSLCWNYYFPPEPPQP